MSNGKYFAGFSGGGTYPVTYLDQYDPVISNTNGNTELYLTSDVKEFQPKVYAREYDPSFVAFFHKISQHPLGILQKALGDLIMLGFLIALFVDTVF